MDENLDCARQLIYDRAKSIGALGRFEKIAPLQDWSTGIDSRPRTVVRQDQRIAEEQGAR